MTRAMPPFERFASHDPKCAIRQGEAIAAVGQADSGAALKLESAFSLITLPLAGGATEYTDVVRMLGAARRTLELKTGGSGGTFVAQGQVFDYFSEVAEKVAQAKNDQLVVDPYLNHAFVKTYLPGGGARRVDSIA